MTRAAVAIPMLAVTVRRVSCPLERERILERLPQALGDQLGSFGLRELVGDHDELVSAEAPKRVDIAQDVIESLGDRLAGAHRRHRG